MTQIVNKIVAAIKKFLESKSGKAAKQGFAKKMSPLVRKALPGIAGASLLGEIPGVKEVVTAAFDLQDQIITKVFQTPLSKIPGLGKVTDQIFNASRTIGKEGGKALGLYNNPAWYTNLGIHTEFKLPFVYPESLPLPFGTGVERASLAIINTMFNPWAAPSQRNQRLSETLDLLKGVRGLSGNLPYTQIDLANYLDAAILLLNEYGRLKFALRAMNYFSLTKTSMPRHLINAIGFDYDDMLMNKAQFQAQLVVLHNFITNTVPFSGDIFAKVFHSWDAMMPDSNDMKVATLYKTNLVVMTNQQGTIWGACFSNNPEFSFTPQSKYVDYVNACQQFITQFLSIDKYASIRGDLVGAFGTSVVWRDSGLKEVENFNTNIIAPMDELYLTAIQNATLLSSRGYIDGSTTTEPGGITSLISSNSFKLEGIDNIRESIPMEPAHIQVTATTFLTNATTFKISWPAVDGFKGISDFTLAVDNDDAFARYINNETSIIGNKYSYNEGEALEILQFQSWVDGASTSLGDGAEFSITTYFRTHEFSVATIDMIYYTDLGVVAKIPFENLAVPTKSNIRGDANQLIKRVIESAALWSQMDYGPKVSFMVNSLNDEGNVYTAVLQDYNVMGSISRSAFEISVAYSTYSLSALSLSVGNRVINNIAEVYANKSKTYSKNSK